MRYELDMGTVNMVCTNMDRSVDELQQAIQIVGDLVGRQMKAYAQANAPWTDRTGNARQGIQSEVTVNGDQLEIILKHTVDYGIWLELAMQRRYKILEESVQQGMPTLMREVGRLIR